MPINTSSNHAPETVPSASCNGIRVQLVTDEMREIAAFCASGREVDRLLSQNKTNTALRNLRRMLKGVLYNISERTPGYIAQIQNRWGSRIDVKSFIKARCNKHATFEERIQLLRIEWREDLEAQEFIDEFESSVISIELHACPLDLRYKVRTLFRTVFEYRDRGLRYRLLSLIMSHYRGLLNFEHELQRLNETWRAAPLEARTDE
jgi:hypothetical protein